MNLRIFFYCLCFLPLSLGATTIETQIGDLLGQSYKSEAAQSFFKQLQLKTDFPDHHTFTYNFYKKGMSVKVTGGEYIQAIQVYNQTMLFQTFPESVYGKKLSEVYDLNDVYKVVRMAPIAEDKDNGIFIYPNKKPADYLIRVIRKPDQTMRSIAWVMDDNAMEQVIAASHSIAIKGLESHEAVWTLLGSATTSEAGKAFYGNEMTIHGKTKVYQHCPSIGMFWEAYTTKGTRHFQIITFVRRGLLGSPISFPHALPEGLTWWSTLEEINQVFPVKIEEPSIGFYFFEKETERGIIQLTVNNGFLSKVTFEVKK